MASRTKHRLILGACVVTLALLYRLAASRWGWPVPH